MQNWPAGFGCRMNVTEKHLDGTGKDAAELFQVE
jgi:hypothetical protein